jgi:Uma2 family endonuclease
VEVLSPSTRLKDKHTKFDLYQDFGIRYYLIVDPEDTSILYYQLNEDGKYVLSEKLEAFELGEDCEITPDLSNIW